jgi:hypothetical protein
VRTGLGETDQAPLLAPLSLKLRGFGGNLPRLSLSGIVFSRSATKERITSASASLSALNPKWAHRKCILGGN